MNENISWKKEGIAVVILKSLPFFILGPVLSFVVVWVMCSGRKDSGGCGDMILIFFPLFTFIGAVLGVSYLVYNVRKGNQNRSLDFDTSIENTLSNGIDGTRDTRKVGWKRIVIAIFAGAVASNLLSLLMTFIVGFLLSLLNLKVNALSMFVYPLIHLGSFVCFGFVFMKVASR